jgi:hypothetical protein
MNIHNNYPSRSNTRPVCFMPLNVAEGERAGAALFAVSVRSTARASLVLDPIGGRCFQDRNDNLE